MTDRERSFTVLLALLDLARAGLPSTSERVAGRIAMCRPLVDAALTRLTRAGFVRGARLTLQGLALASSLDTTRASVTMSRAA